MFPSPNNPLKDSRMVGEICQSPVDLEAITKGRWIALNGRDCNRGSYPELSPLFPIGTFTSTSRTINAAPASATLVADSTNFLAPGAAGTSALQASADGITWVTSATWTAATSPVCIIKAGSRFVMAGSGGDLTQPYVAAIDQTAANIVAKANWTATTGGTTPTSTLVQCLAYGATANAGAGRTVLVRNGSQTTANGLFYMNDAATAWNACSGGSTLNRQCVVWSGQKFFAFGTGSTQLYQTSSDGATFADAYWPWFVNSISSAASDGNGTVVAQADIYFGANTSQLVSLVTKDHGVTWKVIPVPNEVYAPSAGIYVSYVNGRFMAIPAAEPRYGTLLSVDGESWTIDNIALRGVNYTVANTNGIAYKSGVYCFVNQSTTGALTAVEDMSKFRLRLALPTVVTAVGYRPATEITYIKARSK